ncbi:DUF3800 domain-containing protein [Clostridium perfringens]|uniref:DUF3800 domain-containing protein n=1 Tax=Clostridium perfringens TaxID=1502 RepID=UPI00224518BB|nr:DUF3800 domain-containing protein [Clostridium perfringens]MCX0370550.1 DUF3800 domain-containing protein [Clostridium perfringens]
MKIYLDESGNTGNVITKDGVLNFTNQRHFVLGGIKIKNDEEKKILLNKYTLFKEIFGITGEIKGSDLMTRKYNDELKYFIENILDDSHFEICIYDKKFYLVTLLLTAILGHEFKEKYPIEFYNLASEYLLYSDEILIQYCKLAKSPNRNDLKKLLNLILKLNFKYIPDYNNPLKLKAIHIIDNEEYDSILSGFMTFGWYDNDKYINLINLNALCEIIFSLKSTYNLSNTNIEFFHDKITGFDKTFLAELEPLGVNLNFVDSEDEELIQIADNIVSIVAKCVNRTIEIFEEKKEWYSDSEWILTQYSNVLNIIGLNNIKFTIPMCNWAVSGCVKDMFAKGYPKYARKNIYFNKYYSDYFKFIYDSIFEKYMPDESIIEWMNK